MARTVIVDTGALIALISKRDQHHQWAVEQASSLPLPWVTCEAVISETWHRIGASADGRRSLLAMLRRGALSFPFALPSAMGRLADMLGKYEDLPTSIADINLVLIAEALPDSTIWTTDQDFTIYRVHGRRPLAVLLPA